MLEYLKLWRENFNRHFPEEESENSRLLVGGMPLIFCLQQQQLMDICNDINLEKIFEANGKEGFEFFCANPKNKLRWRH